MIRNLGLAFKLIIFILTSTTIIFVAAFVYDYHYSKKTLLKNIEENARNLTLSTVYKIETVLRAVEVVPLNVASIIEKYSYQRKDLLKLVESAVAINPEIFGSTFAFEPYAFNPNLLYFAPYYYRNDGKIILTFLGSDSYRYFFLDWYQIPKEIGSQVWSEPFYDEGAGNIIMSTYSVPFYNTRDGKRKFRGVVTADISLMWLKDIVSSVKIYQTGYAFLISQNGVMVTHPEKQLIMKESIFSIAEARQYPTLRRIGRKMITGEQGFVPLKDFVSGKKSWMYYAPLPSNGWSLGVIFPEDELFADVSQLSITIILIGGLGFLFLCIVIAFFSRTITKPLGSLAKSTLEIVKGNLDIELPEVRSNDEIGKLTGSFKEMKVALKEYIANLAATTAAKERMESELKIARTIQMSFLPKRFPPFPDKDEFEIFASLEPAKEIGGDLYDFFLLDEAHLFFVVGDVSDKGIPAALFMAVTKTLLKGTAEPHLKPSDILKRVNAELCQDNESNMFVTVFCGILNFKSGELFYSNAGHNPPVFVRAGQDPEWLKLPEGFFLGVFEDSQYQTKKLELQSGDLLLVYTDGVTEAMNESKELYSDQRLLETIRACPDNSSEEIVNNVFNAVKGFSKEVSQADDITVLALRLKEIKKDSPYPDFFQYA